MVPKEKMQESGNTQEIDYRTLTPKQHIRRFVELMPDDVTMDEVFYKLELFVGVFEGLQEIERGEFVENDELFDELMKEDEKKASHLVQKGQKKSSGDKTIHRAGLAKNGSKVRKPPKRVRK
jgi:hypothetical protein